VNIWIRFFTKTHIFIYRMSNGWMGSRLGKQSILLLNTIGRRSGKNYITTLSYYRDGSRYLIVGSNWGEESQPSWYYNLLNQPRITIQVRSKIIPVVALPTEGEEYLRLWQLVTDQNEQYITYQKDMKRKIPIVILTPTQSQSNIQE
jgi:deazaflavin-dependent oxidoreductase (nitroreductase family)